MTNIKRAFLGIAECPHCLKPLEIFKETKTISPATKAEKEEKVIVGKGAQTRIDEH